MRADLHEPCWENEQVFNFDDPPTPTVLRGATFGNIGQVIFFYSKTSGNSLVL